jgi:hypothetical protein
MKIEDILAPGRALESLMRRAARGHKPSYRLLLELTPALCEAEDRLLYPELLKARASGLERAWLMPFGGEHDQMLQIVEQLNVAPPSSREDPMFRALQWLVARHVRAEREWLQDALTREPLPDGRKLARYVEHTRPMVERVQKTTGRPSPESSSDDARFLPMSLNHCIRVA